jgi:hypothetical protein
MGLTMRMTVLFAAGVVASFLGAGFACRAGEPFTDEASILVISREDQANDLKTKRLKKEFTLPAAIAALTTYQKVTRDQYLTYAHQRGAFGKVTLKGGKDYSWDIEPDYAAIVKGAHGEIIYLLHPKLDAQPAPKGKTK